MLKNGDVKKNSNIILNLIAINIRIATCFVLDRHTFFYYQILHFLLLIWFWLRKLHHSNSCSNDVDRLWAMVLNRLWTGSDCLQSTYFRGILWKKFVCGVSVNVYFFHFWTKWKSLHINGNKVVRCSCILIFFVGSHCSSECPRQSRRCDFFIFSYSHFERRKISFSPHGSQFYAFKTSYLIEKMYRSFIHQKVFNKSFFKKAYTRFTSSL